jgi:hypothetical protein
MKFIINLKSALAASALVAMLGISSCKPDPPPPEPTRQEIVSKMLNGVWPTLSSVTIEGDDGAELFKGFSLAFSPTTYATTGTTPVWKRSGTWTFANEDATILTRDDGLEVTIENIDDKNLKLVLYWDHETSSDGGRTRSLKGKHEFILAR